MAEKNNHTNHLSKDWKWVKLGDALDYVIGGDWGKDENFEDSNYGLAYCIRGSEIRNWEEEKGRTASLRKIKLSNIEKRKLVDGDVLVEISGGGPEQPVGRTVLIDKTVLSYKPEIPKICTNFLRLIRPKDYVEGKFLNFYLKHFYYSGEIVKYQGGSNNLRNLKFPDYIKINIPLPSKPTQLAIVSKIEELFSEIENGIKSLFSAKEQLKTYRQSVLKWAFEGKLTNGLNGEKSLNCDLCDLPDLNDLGNRLNGDLNDSPDEHDLRNANRNNHNNQKNQKNHSSDKGELPEGWKWVKINEIAKIKGGKRLPPKHQYSTEPTDFIYIMAGNLKDGTVRNKPTFIKEETYNALANYKVTGGEVYITIVGACIGDAGIVPDNIGKSILTENAAKIIELKETYNRYLALWINSTICQANIKSKILSATLGKLALNRIGTLEVPLAPITEQKKIVQEIESRLSVADKMEESITQSLQQAEALKQSILKKAFEGRLV